MSVGSQVPDAGTPIFDAKGYIHPVWHQFFFTLLRRTGGSEGVDAGSEADLLAKTVLRLSGVEADEYGNVAVIPRHASSDMGSVPTHGVQSDPVLHAVATSALNGFMSATDKARIDALSSSGSPTFATITLTNGQVVFPAVQVPSADPNTLDDYEEGVWTPTLTFSTPGNLAVTYSIRTGTYTKIGRMVFVTFQIATSAFTFTTASGALLVSGFPFASGVPNQVMGPIDWSGITKAGYTSVQGIITNGATSMQIVASGSGVGRTGVLATDTPTGGAMVIAGTISYFV